MFFSTRYLLCVPTYACIVYHQIHFKAAKVSDTSMTCTYDPFTCMCNYLMNCDSSLGNFGCLSPLRPPPLPFLDNTQPGTISDFHLLAINLQARKLDLSLPSHPSFPGPRRNTLATAPPPPHNKNISHNSHVVRKPSFPECNPSTNLIDQRRDEPYNYYHPYLKTRPQTCPRGRLDQPAQTCDQPELYTPGHAIFRGA